jgi:hypothetical protein
VADIERHSNSKSPDHEAAALPPSHSDVNLNELLSLGRICLNISQCFVFGSWHCDCLVLYLVCSLYLFIRRMVT